MPMWRRNWPPGGRSQPRRTGKPRDAAAINHRLRRLHRAVVDHGKGSADLPALQAPIMKEKKPGSELVRTGPRLSCGQDRGDSGGGNLSGKGLAGGGGEPPACAGNVLRFRVNMLFKTYQLPVAGAVGESETGFAGEPDHDVVGAQRIAEQPAGAQRGGATFHIPEQRRTDALALPTVVDRQAELETPGVSVERVAGFADDGLDAVEQHDGDHAEAVGLADMDEMIE